ncbi:XRE family transcriptional regulator [Eubacterium sp. 1001713B170207_170306_E7]|uniref:XRE family transcriptional regulator n=1 Tax=Eubacterium sp. 1001713B170207_170306_E7 TaxID=2787097 RepID=UPI001898E664|nr:XRE family transcriptional regulator [Eubacterium sp. 1001713B170207_170306_E7]
MNKYRQLRKERNLSQANLAERLGVSQTAVSQWETDKNYPDINTIKQLADIYSVTTDYLLGVDSSRLKKDNEIVVYTRVPAGVEWANIEERAGYEELGVKMLENGKTYVGFKVSDDEMAPVFLKNDVLIIEVRDNCEDGEIALVQVSGYDAEIKYVFMQPNGVLVQPLVPSKRGDFYANTSKEKARILGVVRQVRRSL